MSLYASQKSCKLEREKAEGMSKSKAGKLAQGVPQEAIASELE